MALTEINRPDSVKAQFGNSDDLEIYHVSNGYIDNNTNHLYVRNNVDGDDGGNIYIQAKSGEHSIICNDDGVVELYKDGGKSLQTDTNGIVVYASEDGSCNVWLYADEGDDNADKWRMQASTNGSFYIDNYTSGSWENSLFATGNGQTALHYDNVKKFNTHPNGAEFHGTMIKQTGTGATSLQIGSSNAGGATIYLDGDSDGDFAGGDYASIGHTTGGDIVITCDSPGQDSNFYVNHNSSSATETGIFSGTNAGVKLYYDNVMKFETTSHGADFYSTAPSIVGIHSTDGGNTSEARLALGALSSNPPEQRGVQVVAYNMDAGHHMDLRTSSTHSAGPTTKMRIQNNGCVLINTTNQNNVSNGGVKIETEAVAGNACALNIRNPDTGGSSQVSLRYNMDRSGGGIHFTAGEIRAVKETTWTSTASTVDASLEFSTIENENLNNRMRIASDGGIYFYGLLGNADAGSNVKFSNSDSELRYDTSSKLLKTNITSLTKYGIDTIKKLKPCTFKPQEYNKDGTITVTDRTLIGFIADEMVEEVPEVIQSYPKSTLTKNPDDTEIVPAAISYDKLTVVLTKALQEAITKIETLETKVAALEAG